MQPCQTTHRTQVPNHQCQFYLLSGGPFTDFTRSLSLTEVLKGFLEPARNLRRVLDLYCNIHMVFLNGYTIMEALSGQDIYGDDDINRVICELANEKHW